MRPRLDRYSSWIENRMQCCRFAKCMAFCLCRRNRSGVRPRGIAKKGCYFSCVLLLLLIRFSCCNRSHFLRIKLNTYNDNCTVSFIQTQWTAMPLYIFFCHFTVQWRRLHTMQTKCVHSNIEQYRDVKCIHAKNQSIHWIYSTTREYKWDPFGIDGRDKLIHRKFKWPNRRHPSVCMKQIRKIHDYCDMDTSKFNWKKSKFQSMK